MKRSNSAPLIAYSERRDQPPLGLQRRQGMSNSNISLPADCSKLEVSISPTKQVLLHNGSVFRGRGLSGCEGPW